MIRSNRQIRTLKTFSISLLILLLSSIAFGQGGVATGDLHVTVKDPTGNLVANATVTVADVAKGVERTATGDGQGGYTARLLPPGTYTVTVAAPGFGKAEAKDVSITVGGLVDSSGRSGGRLRPGSGRGQFSGGLGGDLAHLDHGHDRTAPHRQSADQRSQLH